MEDTGTPSVSQGDIQKFLMDPANKKILKAIDVASNAGISGVLPEKFRPKKVVSKFVKHAQPSWKEAYKSEDVIRRRLAIARFGTQFSNALKDRAIAKRKRKPVKRPSKNDKKRDGSLELKKQLEILKKENKRLKEKLEDFKEEEELFEEEEMELEYETRELILGAKLDKLQREHTWLQKKYAALEVGAETRYETIEKLTTKMEKLNKKYAALQSGAKIRYEKIAKLNTKYKNLKAKYIARGDVMESDFESD